MRNIGDKVFVINNNKIWEVEIEEISINKSGINYYVSYQSNRFFRHEDFTFNSIPDALAAIPVMMLED